jgi:hypothetical protein
MMQGYIKNNGVYVRFDALSYRTYKPPKGKKRKVKAVIIKSQYKRNVKPLRTRHNLSKE